MSEEFDQLIHPGSDDQPESGRSASKRRGPFVALLAMVAVLVATAAVLIVGGLQGGTGQPVAAPSALASYGPAPLVTKPFGPSDPDTYVAPVVPPGDALSVPSAAAPAGPSTVSIPSIGVSTTFQAKDLLPGDILDLPADGAAWYGQTVPVTAVEGSTVISGHVNTATNGKGPLGGLAEVQKGAPVTVTDADGTAHAYKIETLTTVDKDKLDPAWFNPKDKRQLVLITCGGEVQDYNQYGLPNYTHNTVAVAVPVDAA